MRKTLAIAAAGLAAILGLAGTTPVAARDSGLDIIIVPERPGAWYWHVPGGKGRWVAPHHFKRHHFSREHRNWHRFYRDKHREFHRRHDHHDRHRDRFGRRDRDEHRGWDRGRRDRDRHGHRHHERGRPHR